MNKLGFYVENTTVQYLRDALRNVLPPVMLIHAGDRGLLREIRAGLSPNTFVIGRLFVDQSQQNAWLDSGDPAAAGRSCAEQIINYDFNLAKERGQNGRLLIDAWMSLNEPVRGPASFPDGKPDVETKRRLAALDAFQEAFYLRLRADGLEAVAFNFAAGNFTEGSHYLEYFPRTLTVSKYLGFHEYGWPTLEPRSDTATAALLYRRAMTEIRKKYGDRHQVIVTELGLARMYKYPAAAAGDVGWLYPGETISQDQYWTSLQWYNAELLRDSYVLGCALFNVGHAGKWETFRHLGVDNQGRPILLMDKIATLNAPVVEAKPAVTLDLADLYRRMELVQSNLDLIITNCDTVLRQLAALEVVVKALADAMTSAPTPEEILSLIRRLDTVKSNLGLLAQAGVTGVDIPALQALADNLLTQARALQAPVQQSGQLQQDIGQAQESLRGLANQTQTVVALKQQAQVLHAEADALTAQLGAPQPPQSVPQPLMQDKRTTLPTAPGASFATRPSKTIKRVIVHHTVTRDDVTPERLAQAQVAQGKPGITYHFLVNGDGTITWTQPIERTVEQTLVPEVNADGIAVALAGNFQQAVPSAAQMASAALLIAWLLNSLGLTESAMYGRGELDKRVISPGAQWLQGARYKDTLLTQVRAILTGQQ